jgi:hypothetical protein
MLSVMDATVEVDGDSFSVPAAVCPHEDKMRDSKYCLNSEVANIKKKTTPEADVQCGFHKNKLYLIYVPTY